uniref:Portal protein n=1 Tax=Myoviridae sp. ctCL221 TaxID=2826630 RepID=A0A8S5M6N2_9CAUD|nr:MAG TPA: portal protein [Myoviridae sp. ctCL221]
MKIRNIFKKKIKNEANEETIIDENAVSDVILKALLEGEEIDREKVLMIPAVSSAVGLICDSFAMIPFKLYKKTTEEGKKQTTEVENERVNIINYDTGDTLDGFQFKKAIAEDYLLGKGGYAYINKRRNNFIGLNYVQENKVLFERNTDAIFKNYNILVDGNIYRPYEFLKILRNTKNGAYGTGYTKEISKSLETAYKRIIYDLELMRTGGNKKGFLKAQKHLDEKGMSILKSQWNDYFAGNSSCVILNDGMEFQEASNTSVENQLNEKNKTFSEEVKEIFHIGKTNEDFLKNAIMPLATAFCTALNRDFLLEKEKKSYYFAPDYTELIRCTIKERFEAYQIAITSGFKTRNEVRYLEGDDALDGLDMINIGLGDVLFDPKTKQIYTPNTNKMVKMNDMNQENEQIETTQDEENNKNEQKSNKEAEGGEQIEE